MTIPFDVCNQQMELCENVFMASETVNYIDCRFCFSEEWSGFEKTAVFSNIGGSYSVPLSNDTCIVPHEVLSDSFNVSVFGIQSDRKFRRITTNAVSIQIFPSGYKEGDTPEEPTPGVYETIVLRLTDGEKQIKAVEDKNTQLGAEINSVKSAVYADKAAIKTEIDGCYAEINGIKTDLSKLPEKYATKTHLHKAEDITDLNIPTNTSQLDNDSGFVEDKNYVHTNNNYTDAEKAKLAGLHLYDDTGIKAEIDAKADIPHTTASGYPLELTDSLADESLTDCKIWGNTDGVGDLATADNKYHVPITVCGKNLIPYPYTNTTKTVNGITFTDNGDGTVTANGTATAVADFTLGTDVFVPKGTFLSGVTGGSATTYEIQIYLDSQNYVTTYKKSTSTTEFRAPARIRIRSGVTVDNLVFKPQLEFGSTATEYEQYITPSAAEAVLDTPLAPGEYIDLIRKKRVNGSTETDITVTGELKTVDSDVNNIICGTTVAPEKVEVEYYQDINKVITEIKNAILAQGGNT